MSVSACAIPESPGRLPVLDGVRAISILLVLATHLLPLNAIWPGANNSSGMLGMALFFVLSGFLIGGQVLRRGPVLAFVVQRLARILPLAWLCAVIVALTLPMEPSRLLGHLFFYANLPPKTLTFPLDHYWSLCIEVQFYAIAALLLCLRPAYTSIVISILLVCVATFRILTGSTGGSITWIRGDDILAGCMLAILLNSDAKQRVRQVLSTAPVLWLSGMFLCASCVMLPTGNPINYTRSYAAAVWVGALICQPSSGPARCLSHHRWAYLAAVSYALYVVHLPLTATWLGSGDLLEKYLKRPLLLGVTFGLAHLSTFHFECHFTEWGRRYGHDRKGRLAAS